MPGVDDATNIAVGFLPKFQAGGSSLINMLAWLFIVIVFVTVIAVAVILIIKSRKYNKIIKIYEKINGKFEQTKKDTAREMRFSTGGDTIFYLRKHKKYLPIPELQSGRRIYLYYIRSDGEWINFEHGDFDKEAKQLGARFLDKEMRYARTQIQKGLKERYDEPSFWKQYGLLIFSISFITIIGVMTLLLFDKWIDLAKVTNAGVEMVPKVLDRVEAVLGSMDNICSGGSGYVSVGG